MPLNVDQLTEEALALPKESRALLADKLVESLERGEAGKIEKQWVREALRRRDEVRSCRVRTIPGDEALAQVRRLVGL